MFELVISIIGTIFLLFTITAVIAWAMDDISIIDIIWGLSLWIISITVLIHSQNYQPPMLVLLAIITLWAFRLSYHIADRKRGKPEDYRYTAMRQNWGKHQFLNSLTRVFWLQALLSLLIATPIILASVTLTDSFSLTQFIGLIVCAVGIITESLADKQLRDFKQSPSNQGKLMTEKLWSLSRHPNYFGEWLFWVGIFIYSINHWLSLLGIISPLLMYLFLRYISGVPLLEEKMKHNRAFATYQEQTPMFFPCWRRQKKDTTDTDS